MGFAFLDVAIGMTFLFLMLSLICSAVNELISALIKARADFLEQGITRMLQDKAFVQRLYAHPLIHNLGGEVRPWLQKLRVKERPAYIPARSFALAIMDMVQPETGVRNAVVPTPAPVAGRPAAPPSGAPLALALSLNTSLPPGVREALAALVNAAGMDAAIARQNIEGWYNSTMDRVSGAYKRRTQYAIFCIGLVVTIGVNADSIVVFKRLTTDKTLSAAIAQAASNYTTAPLDSNADNAKDNTKPSTDQQIAQARSRLNDSVATLDRLGLPIGWDGTDAKSTPPDWILAKDAKTWSQSIRLLGLHWAGWLLTAFAVSFGAPFWFDLLNRFMVVRSTIKPEEKSQPEASKN